MNLPWDKYEYSEPFLVQTGTWSARYYMWRRNNRTGQYKLKLAGGIAHRIDIDSAENHKAPNPLEMFPPLVTKTQL